MFVGTLQVFEISKNIAPAHPNKPISGILEAASPSFAFSPGVLTP